MKCNIQKFQPYYGCSQAHIRRKSLQKRRDNSRKSQQAAIQKNPEKPGRKKRLQKFTSPPQADCQKNRTFPHGLTAECRHCHLWVTSHTIPAARPAVVTAVSGKRQGEARL